MWNLFRKPGRKSLKRTNDFRSEKRANLSNQANWLIDVLKQDLPGTLKANGDVGLDEFNLTLRGMQDTTRLWSTRVQLARDGSGRRVITISVPQVNKSLLDTLGENVGPTLLRNAASAASRFGVHVMAATASMNMGRGLTGSGFLPCNWGSLRQDIVVAIREGFPADVQESALEGVAMLGERSVRMFVPLPDDFGGISPRLAAEYPEACKDLFKALTWEAEIDLRDAASSQLFDWSMARRGIEASGTKVPGA